MTGRLKPLLYKRSLPPQTKKLGDGSAVSLPDYFGVGKRQCHLLRRGWRRDEHSLS